MTTSEFRTIPPDEHQHLRLMAQLAADVFTEGKYVDQFCENYIGNSHYDWDVSRLVLDGEKVLHHWGVWGYQMRVETSQLKVAGIGAVVTHPDYRKQGLMHRAAQSSFEAMQQAGYDLSILRGRHYVKMGYARAWNYVTYRLKLNELPGVGQPSPYRALEADQVVQMDGLYNQTHAGFTGTAIRPTYANRYPEDIGVYAWFDEQNKLAGYVRAFAAEDNPKVLQCLEAAGDPCQGLAVLADLLKNEEYESLAFFTLPYAHPMLQLLRKGACIVEDRYFDITGWRVKMLNLHSSLQKLLPLLETRLASSQFADWQGSLLLDSGEQKATLEIEGGKVVIGPGEAATHSLRGGADIARFLIGSDEPEEIIQQAGMEASGLALPLARVLFPNLHPMMSHWDEY
jgi:predicted N-acetyltransferase YhbS